MINEKKFSLAFFVFEYYFKKILLVNIFMNFKYFSKFMSIFDEGLTLSQTHTNCAVFT
jgi:hypothetical protein